MLCPIDPSPAVRRRRRGFTLVEMLVVVTIISMLAGITLRVLKAARNTAAEMRTKATIAKLDHLIMAKYQSYMTRRVPIDTSGLPPNTAAELRLKAVRRLMQFELPDRQSDVPDAATNTVDFTVGGVTRTMPMPAVKHRYRAILDAKPLGDNYRPAEMLYILVSAGIRDGLEQFKDNEIGDADGDGSPEFHDGWGRPIMFLRFAPGFSDTSPIQSGDPTTDHDPFDTHQVDGDAFHLIPLIYSAGPDKKYDINLGGVYAYADDPFVSPGSELGTPTDDPDEPDGDLNHYDNIHNHLIEQR